MIVLQQSYTVGWAVSIKEEQTSQMYCKSRQNLTEVQQNPPTRPVP